MRKRPGRKIDHPAIPCRSPAARCKLQAGALKEPKKNQLVNTMFDSKLWKDLKEHYQYVFPRIALARTGTVSCRNVHAPRADDPKCQRKAITSPDIQLVSENVHFLSFPLMYHKGKKSKRRSNLMEVHQTEICTTHRHHSPPWKFQACNQTSPLPCLITSSAYSLQLT